MAIKKERKILIVLIIASLFLGYLITASRHTGETSKNAEKWYQITSQSSPAFFLEMPGVPKHTINGNTATIQSLYEDNTYLIGITDYEEETKKFSKKEIFQKTIDLLKTGDKILIGLKYADNGNSITDFHIVNPDAVDSIRGQMLMKDNYLILQIVNFNENSFPEENYQKFIDSLKINEPIIVQ
ncbi:hypothetical protein HY604_04315 [Candidatus Peregrinibacteria bacterium]|nr:hypothetical protein [Candidatus Peregrinibacteria bacterium]